MKGFNKKGVCELHKLPNEFVLFVDCALVCYLVVMPAFCILKMALFVVVFSLIIRTIFDKKKVNVYDTSITNTASWVL